MADIINFLQIARMDRIRLKAEQEIHDLIISGGKYTLQDARDKIIGKSKIKTNNKIKAADYCMEQFGKNNFLAYSTYPAQPQIVYIWLCTCGHFLNIILLSKLRVQ